MIRRQAYHSETTTLIDLIVNIVDPRIEHNLELYSIEEYVVFDKKL